MCCSIEKVHHACWPIGNLTFTIFWSFQCEQKAHKPQTAGPFILSRFYHCRDGQASLYILNFASFQVCGALPTRVEWVSYCTNGTTKNQDKEEHKGSTGH
jgi:hypothetical protein